MNGFGSYKEKSGKTGKRYIDNMEVIMAVITIAIDKELTKKEPIKVAQPFGVIADLIPATGLDAMPPLKTLPGLDFKLYNL